MSPARGRPPDGVSQPLAGIAQKVSAPGPRIPDPGPADALGEDNRRGCAPFTTRCKTEAGVSTGVFSTTLEEKVAKNRAAMGMPMRLQRMPNMKPRSSILQRMKPEMSMPVFDFVLMLFVLLFGFLGLCL